MSKFDARLLSFALPFAGLLIAGAADPARAQITVSKDLCGPALAGGGCVIGSGTALPVVAPSTLVSYQITLTNPSTSNSIDVDLGETFPPGFVLVPPSTCDDGTTLTTSGTSPIFFGSVSLLPTQTVICTITGYFNYLPATANNANNFVTVYPKGNHSTPIIVSNPVNAVVGPPSTIPSDVSVVKTAQVTASGTGTATVHYTITVTNNGPNDVYGLQLQDRVSLPSTSIPLTVTYQGNGICSQWVTSSIGTVHGTSDCFGAAPSTIHSPVFVPSTNPVDFVEWSYPTASAGLLKNGNSMVIEFDAVIAVPTGIACQLVVGGNSLINEAHIGFNIPGATTTTFESAPGNNTSTVPVPITFNAAVDPNCGKPALQITKKLLPPQTTNFDWTVNNTVTYEITLQNLSTTLPITNIQLIDTAHSLGDFVSGGIGTPAFTATMVNIACLPAVCGSTMQAGSTTVAGYLQPYWMLGTIVAVPANQSVSIQLQIKYTNPECDSYPDVTRKPVLNFVRASYSDPTLGGATITLQTAPAIALFEPPKPCNFKVTKAVTGGSQKIVFGQNVNYTVTYQNLSAQPATIGTMIDALRIVQPNYASPLTVHYSYTCTATAGVTGYPVASTGTPVVQVVPTALPQQGVRIIQNLVPVIFPANSTVTCNVTINVDKPPPGPHCARLGELENAAIMDQSAFYDPNLLWPSNTNPGFAAKVSLPLPQCFNLVVNKGVKPIWTTQNGGPLNYQLIISNLGDPIVASDGVTLTDAFVPVPLWNYVGSALVNQCLNSSNFFSVPQPQCDYNWSPPPTSNPSTLNITALAQNWAASPSFQVVGPYPAPYPAKPGQVCNDAAATLTGLKPDDWYPNDPSTWKTNRCVPIFTVSDLKVTKVVQAVAPALPPPPTSFTVNVNCVLILNNMNYAPSQTFTFNYPPDPIPSQGMSNIPVGSTCTIVEQPLPTTPIPNRGCPSGLAAWGPIQYPNVLDPKQSLQSLVIGASSNALEALNSLACVPVKTNIKICKVAGPGIAVGTPFTFTVGSSTLTVPAGPAPGGTCVLGPSFPVGSTVTVSETISGGAIVSSIAVVPTSRLVGTPNLAGGSVNVAIGSGLTDVTFTNQRTGFLEICKSGDVTGSFNFTVNPGGLGPFAVPAGACSPAIQVVAGPVVIQEAPTPGIGMTGCATVPANQQGPCNLGAGTSTVTVASGDVSTTTIAMITNGQNTATLTVKKLFVAPPGGTLPNLAGVVFPVNVVCTPSGPSTSVTLTAANPSQVIANIPLGSTCNVVEPPLTSTGTCGKPLVSVALPPTYLPGQNVTITAPPASPSVEVTNVMACVQMGSLSVTKRMAPGPAVVPIPPGVTFPVQVACTPNGPNQTVNLTAATPTVTLPNIVAGSVCTLTELTPVGPIPPNCHWGPVTYPSGQSATIPAQPTVERIVQNMLVCIPPPAGSLTVKKIVSASPNGIVPNLSGVVFPVNVVCTPSGPSTSVTLTAATLSQVIPNIPVGSTCNVVEQPLTSTGTCPRPLVSVLLSPPTYVPGQNVTITAPPAAPGVEVHNVIGCVPVLSSACVLDPGMVAASNTFARRITLAQTFTPTLTGSLTTITHGLETISGSVINYNLLVTTTTGGLPSWTGGSTTTPNVLLAMTGVTIFSSSSLVNGAVPIPAGQQPHLTAGTQYALILIPGTPTNGFMAWRGNSSAGSYPNGSAYELNGTTWTVPGTGPKDHGFKLDGLCP